MTVSCRTAYFNLFKIYENTTEYIRIIKLLFVCREKKREKERDELWKRLSELEVNNKVKKK